MAHCPECGGLIDLEGEELEEGGIVSCPECDVELEVVNTKPLELSVVEESNKEEDSEKEDTDEQGKDSN